MNAPAIQRVRFEIKRRRLTVQALRPLTPKMLRIVLGGPELDGFLSQGFDDHIKLMFGPEMRDFTPRHYDTQRGELWIDFALHEAGPATTWAASAEPGMLLEIGGPRGSFIIPTDIPHQLLIGDETALPAIGRRLQELPAGVKATVIAEIDAESERQHFESSASFDVIWVFRRGGPQATAAGLLGALSELQPSPTDCFAWVAAESRVARQIRQRLLEGHEFDKAWVKAAGYWQRGVNGAHDRIED